MEILELELAGEYLLMAAMLAEIKSGMLLPRHTEDNEEEDPRAELIRRLQEYERYKEAAEKLDKLPRYERDIFSTVAEFTGQKTHHKPPEVSMESILQVFSGVIARADMFSHLMIEREVLSVRERMGIVLERVNTETFTDFKDLFTLEEGRAGVIVLLLAILQLMKDSLIQLVQNETNGPIYVKAAS
jgi:segregation and condensation protein A